MNRVRHRDTGRQNPANLALRLALGALVALWSLPAANAASALRQIADTYAGSAVVTGQAIGVGVAIIEGDRQTRFFDYGKAVVGGGETPSKRFAPDLLFSIGSVTKVFTTNLLGQRVYTGALQLQQPLSDFQAQLGQLEPLTAQITLKQLASFTGGIADFPPRCSPPPPSPGCLPARYPNLRQYPVQDLAAFYRSTVPANYQVSPPTPVNRLPAPYYYSDFSMGLVGLLIGGQPQSPLDNRAVRGWFRAVRQDILRPLAMHDTFMAVPPTESGRLVAGYAQALATATVSAGAVSGIDIVSRGEAYQLPPNVRIVGGGGSGATAAATLNADKQIAGIAVTQGGSGYVAPPVITFNNGGSETTPAAEAVIKNGQVVGVYIRNEGTGFERVPDVTITGGQTAGGQPAQLEAEIAGGRLRFVRVIAPGSNYVDPLAVVIAPGAPAHRPVTAWAPSGFIVSTLSDMAIFARAALAERPNGETSDLTEGFRIAQRAYVCQTGRPGLGRCPPGELRGGLAWSIAPADPASGMPTVISKDGGVPGFSTFVTLMPERRLAVVVFVNSVALIPGQKPAPAATIATNILNALFYTRAPAAGSVIR